MILIVGGEGSGKRTFARSLGYRPEDGRPVVFHVERLVLQDPDAIDALYEALVQKEAVLCNEVGSGVIPVDPGERLGRERTGRLCVLLAQRADTVVRMVCGLPMVIKGSL